MKLQSWAILILVVATAGCAASDKSPSADNLAGTPPNGQGALIGDSSGTDEDSFTDEEFDLLEEELDDQEVGVADPLEGFNRLMFGLNDTLYFWIFKPVAQTYTGVVPEPARIGVRNFFQNIGTPVRYVNCLLQGKGPAAGNELHRFWVNTTEGILGFGDPARDKYELQPTWEDLGQTLAVHGMDSGFYIVWPVFGPSTVRDSLGMVGDMFLNPVRYVQPWEASYIISGVRVVNNGSFHIEEYEDFKSAFLEPYIAMRESYIQYREENIKQ
ncbi:MAG: VacJ family lipoprotein [Sedimentisphaerales bacterium]|nr:VacJ family lipoprotein [Sedimentisphaerales bacterium]